MCAEIGGCVFTVGVPTLRTFHVPGGEEKQNQNERKDRAAGKWPRLWTGNSEARCKEHSLLRFNTPCAEMASSMGQPWSCCLCCHSPSYPQDLPALISRVTFCSHGHFAFSRTDGRPVLDAVLGFAGENNSLGLERAESVNW